MGGSFWHLRANENPQPFLEDYCIDCSWRFLASWRGDQSARVETVDSHRSKRRRPRVTSNCIASGKRRFGLRTASTYLAWNGEKRSCAGMSMACWSTRRRTRSGTTLCISFSTAKPCPIGLECPRTPTFPRRSASTTCALGKVLRRHGNPSMDGRVLLREWKQYIWVRFFFMLTPQLRSRQWIFTTGAGSSRPDLRIRSGSSWESLH